MGSHAREELEFTVAEVGSIFAFDPATASTRIVDVGAMPGTMVTAHTLPALPAQAVAQGPYSKLALAVSATLRDEGGRDFGAAADSLERAVHDARAAVSAGSADESSASVGPGAAADLFGVLRNAVTQQAHLRARFSEAQFVGAIVDVLACRTLESLWPAVRPDPPADPAFRSSP